MVLRKIVPGDIEEVFAIYSTETVKILVRFLFEEAGVNRIQAEVMPANVHSKKVLLKNSFQYEGTLRQATLWSGKGIVDLEMYNILASDYQNKALR